MKQKLMVTFLFLLVILPCLAAEEAIDRSGIYTDIGLGMNYSVINNNAFLTPLIGLEFSLKGLVMADLGFSFDTHSSDYSGIQKVVINYYSIHFVGKYFIWEGLWVGSGFAYSMFLGGYTVNAVPLIPGAIHSDLIKFLFSTGYFSKIMEGIYLNPSLVFRVVIPSEEPGSFDLDLGLFFTVSFNMKRD